MIRSKKMSLILVMAVALAMVMAVPQANAARRFVSIASGWVAGAYYPMAGAISRIAWKHLKEKNIKVTAESSGASVANAKLIGAGDTDLAILQNDIANYANKGMKPMYSAFCLLYTSPSPRDLSTSRMPSSA
eukprot:TRINITY_DN67140_c0_g1_i1.p2 TRINITY_DN67140_c0_g1~~TRINITY_DN67140_c0_g1_i1.p2  ORF type:complete len:132 (-),score=38.83 TRINITY_DN67140_c0_g1_i1:123-518(-)